MIETGVASPNAHGQAMTRTAVAFSKAMLNEGDGPPTNHTANVTTAIAKGEMDVGQPATLEMVSDANKTPLPEARIVQLQREIR